MEETNFGTIEEQINLIRIQNYKLVSLATESI